MICTFALRQVWFQIFAFYYKVNKIQHDATVQSHYLPIMEKLLIVIGKNAVHIMNQCHGNRTFLQKLLLSLDSTIQFLKLVEKSITA